MVFSSILFLYYFLPLVLVCYFVSPKCMKNTVLFVSSLIFYAWGEPVYIFLMLFSIAFNYFAVLLMDKFGNRLWIRRLFLIIAVTADLGILGFYKYMGYGVSVINSVFHTSFKTTAVTLPVGISFYTFQIISYVIDVYRKNASAQKNFISIGTYITLFPQLIAGPIVRYTSIDEQLNKRRVTASSFLRGVGTFCIGLSKKVLLANNIGIIWETVKQSADKSVLGAWLGIIAFALQIYYDFSGYSDMAVGLGRMFGFEFSENFNYPYISKSITEFWRRWHISLGTWFKEYLYFPLGGSRKGALRTCINLIIVWFCTGLWHGASSNFVVWGLYYGIILIIEKLFLIKYLRKLPKFIAHIYALVLVIVGWALFECGNIAEALSYIKVMFGGAQLTNESFWYNLRLGISMLVIGIIGAFPFMRGLFYKMFTGKTRYLVTAVLSALSLVVCTAYLLDSAYNPFLYFRF